MQFDLLTNPFAVLGLTGDASVSTITARARDLGTPAAAAASRTLLAPRTRLHAELGFLPGAPQDLADTCLEDLKARREPDLRLLMPPAQANVLAHLASGGMATAGQLRDLVGLQEAIRSASGEVIDRAREHVRMPPVPRDMLDTALETLASQHAEAFAEGMLALPKGADLFAEQLHATAPDATARISFLRQAAAAWDRATASEAAQDLENAAPIEATLRDHPDTKAATQLADVVLRFAGRTKPAREACRLVGLPHQASVDAAQRWRAVALDLNNRQDAVLEAVTVLDALANGFGTTDELGARTARDLDICRERLASGEGTPEVKRLVAAIEAAVEKEVAFQRSAMINGRTTARTPAVVGELHDAFVAAARTARSDLPWRFLRDFVLRLHNEFSATEAALSFTQLAIERGTGTAVASNVMHQLQLDLRALRKGLLNIELAAAVRTNQTSVARRLLAELVTLADDAKERNDFQAALRKLAQQQTAARLKFGFYAALAGIALFFLVISNQDKRPAQSGPTYPSHYNQAPPSAYSPPSPPAVFDPDAGHPERQPAPGTATLTRSELRWCRYENARAQAAHDYLQAIQLNPTTDVNRYNSSVDAYNAFIAPINAACKSYKYWPADRSVVDAELSQNAATLKAEGQHLIATAYQIATVPADRGAPVPAYNPTPAYTPPASAASPSYPSTPSPASSIKDVTAYGQGQTDRKNWESWFAGLTGAFRDGAEWWAGVRSMASPPSCDRAPGLDHATVVAGCVTAQRYFANVDRRRRAEPDYRTGWNNP
jgi:hypothetical protein